jgi:hypothetical protein
MAKPAAVLFEKCPLCGQAKITIETSGRFLFSKPKINSCPTCSAEFAARGENNYQLLFCNPPKIVGKHDCGDRVFRGCYLNATLSKSEWQRIAEGGESEAFSKFLEMSEKLRRGALPTYSSEGLPFALYEGEMVHYVSSPVYLNEQQPLQRRTSDKGDFFLTNKRMVFVMQNRALSVPFESMERVEELQPGFLIKQRESFEPLFFFPPSYDPLFAALLGAIHNFKRRNQPT